MPTERPTVCDSCGRPAETGDEPLVAVHRVYVTPESWDTPGRVDRVEAVEHWCFVCRTHYPHDEAEPPPEPRPDPQT